MHVFLSFFPFIYFFFFVYAHLRGSWSQESLVEIVETGDRYRDVTYNIYSRHVKLSGTGWFMNSIA